jgi:hypothetical protein
VAELVSLPESVGFVEVRIVARFDSYRGTKSHAKLPESFGMGGANLFARKP